MNERRIVTAPVGMWNEEGYIEKGLSGSTLKMIAMVAMFIDHVGAVILERIVMQLGLLDAVTQGMDAVQLWVGENGQIYYIYMVTRAIGRIAFPIFCFLLVEGFMRTKNRTQYAIRLFLFALASEIPFDLAIKGKMFDFTYQNIFFTLLIGFLVMMCMEYIQNAAHWRKSQFSNKILLLLTAFLGMLVAATLRTDYGYLGIMCIVVLYVFRTKKKSQMITGCLAFAWEIYAILAFLVIRLYNGKRGWNQKYLFYVFYPAHLLLLYGIAKIMGIV